MKRLELGDRLVEDLRHRLHGIDPPGDLSSQRDGGLHIAAEVEVKRIGHLAHDVGRRLQFEPCGPLRAQRPQRRAGTETVKEHRVGLLRAHDAVLPVLVNRALGRRDHAGAHLDALGAQGKRSGHAAPIGDATGGDDRQIGPRTDQREQHHGGDIATVLETATLAAFDHQSVDAGVDGLLRRRHRRHHVEHCQPGPLQRLAVFIGIARRSGDELNTLVDHELHDVRVANKGLGDVDAPRFVGEGPHLLHLLAHLVEAARGGLDHAEAASVGHRAGQLGAGDPAHRGLDDGVLHAEQVGDAVFHLLGLPEGPIIAWNLRRFKQTFRPPT